MVWMEDNICIYRYGEILHTSAVLVGTIHVIQGIYINWREPAFSSVVCMLLISQFVTNQICSHVTDLPSFVSLAFLYNPADFLPDYLFHLQCYI